MRTITALCVLLMGSTAAADLTCPSGRVGPTDRVHIALPAGHGPELAIVTPAGRHFFWSYRTHSGDVPPSPLSEAEARALPGLDFRPADLRLRAFEVGATTPEPVFREPGRYEVRVSENLQTNDGTPVDRCSIDFAP